MTIAGIGKKQADAFTGNFAMTSNLERTTCCVAGGGPAGIMLGYLLARAGIRVTVFEKHGDFFRDFRADTVHPSTLQLMAELGLLDELLQIPHRKVTAVGANFGGVPLQMADLGSLRTRCPYIALMPQWDFLNFLSRKASAFPGFVCGWVTRFEAWSCGTTALKASRCKQQTESAR